MHDILLVDDDPKMLEILGVSLGKRGFTVRTASNGNDALAQAADRPPSLVILDLALPDMTGLDVLARLRSSEDSACPVLFLSAEPDLNARVSALEGGAHDFLQKPVPLRELHARIDGALQRSTQARASETRVSELSEEVVKERESTAKASREVKRRLLSMRTLLTVSHDLNRVMPSEDLLKAASLTLVAELRVSNLAIFGLDRENAAHFRLLGVRGIPPERFEGMRIDRSAPFVAMLSEDARPQKIARNANPRWVRSLPDLRLAVFEYVMPITVKNELKGIILTGPKLAGDEYGEYDLDILNFIANSVGIGMENSHLLSQLQVTYIQTLRSLISIVEAKDPYTKGHTERVASYALALANRLGLPDEDLRRIIFSSLLHDIGKMGVLDNIINKPGPLTPEEWELMKAHPVVGAQIVENMEFLPGVVEIVRHHHESYDGKGYPDGIAGTNIPYGARIVTVADSFDAMTTDRPYRKALTHDEAVKRLIEGAGRQFDADMVKVFVAYVNERQRDFGKPLLLTGGPRLV